MPEPLKNIYSQTFIRGLADVVKSHQAAFDADKFITLVFDADWPDLALKARMSRISCSLQSSIQGNYKAQLAIILATAESLSNKSQSGFEFMFLPDFVEQFGLQEFKASTNALATMTHLASGEFAVRPFIELYPEKMMALMLKWTSNKSEHIRRLASEGCRPRLPWAMALPRFKQDPSLVVEILRRLKQDDSLFVRRSVANNLNDISKDNPQVLIDIAQDWFGTAPDTDWLIKHACRGLLKQAQPDIMQLFGYFDPAHIRLNQFSADEAVKFGERLNFSFTLNSGRNNNTNGLGKLRIEFAIDHMKANGKQSRKIFKISESNYTETSKDIQRAHSIKPISTRKYYNGQHNLAILVNGVQLHQQTFVLSGV